MTELLVRTLETSLVLSLMRDFKRAMASAGSSDLTDDGLPVFTPMIGYCAGSNPFDCGLLSLLGVRSVREGDCCGLGGCGFVSLFGFLASGNKLLVLEKSTETVLLDVLDSEPEERVDADNEIKLAVSESFIPPVSPTT